MRHLATPPMACALALGAISVGAGLAVGDRMVPTGISPGQRKHMS